MINKMKIRWTAALSFASLYANPGASGFVPSMSRTNAFRRTLVLPSAAAEEDYGIGMDQAAMMESDMLVAVDRNDVLIDGAVVSKRKAHEFNDEQPRGIAHRAFSIFLFNEKGELLLTRRADSKITFPGVWTNTCCSHPLYAMEPNEVDEVPAAYPNFPGIKHAAIRKLKHELGIDPKYVPHEDFQFLSRFHYWAADTVTYGDEAPWGEHEVDYVLFIQCKNEQPVVHVNEDEISEFKYVTIDELKHMMKEPELKWSPWFCGIMERGCFDWWADLEGALEGKHCTSEVTYFGPPKEHMARFNIPAHDENVGVLVNE
mmetsp:Transcript_16202/g.25215  ORF Transcript_16202/g.25215 Transcript_16202/m.25215 type:complete len:316 (-) Transcript_16202:7-954(-)